MGEKNKNVNVRVPEKYIDLMVEIADREGISLSDAIRDAIWHYLDNRERNQRHEVISYLMRVAGAIGNEKVGREFISSFLAEFKDARQVDGFLAMPPPVILSSIADALAKFEPTGVVPEIDITEEEEAVKYKFEKKKAGDNRR